MTRRTVLLACGPLTALFYVVANVLGPLRWAGYSVRDQAVSELFATDAPSRAIMFPLLRASDIALIAFAFGVWRAARDSESRRPKALRVAAVALFVIAIVGLLTPPMHLREAPKSVADILHIAGTIAIVFATLVGMGAAAAAFGPRFLRYSAASMIVLLGTGLLAGVLGSSLGDGGTTPFLGLVERITIGTYLLWLVVLAVELGTRRWQTVAPRDSLVMS